MRRDVALIGPLTATCMLACTALIGLPDVPGAPSSGSDDADDGSNAETGAPSDAAAIEPSPETSITDVAAEAEAGADVVESSPCDQGMARCLSNAVQTCDADGGWQTTQTCTGQTCSGSSCVGVCEASKTQCVGSGVQTCDANGQWGATVACGAAQPYCSQGACQAPPSCQPTGVGLTNCGAAPGESCCASATPLAAGTFDRTYRNNGSGATGLADPATISAVRVDKYDVTVGRFRQFVSAWNVGWRPAAGSGKHAHLNGGAGLVNSAVEGGVGYEPGWNTSDNANVTPSDTTLVCNGGVSGGATYATLTSSPGGNESKPMNCANWWEAYSFCIWDGGFLPSEAEWEYAAAGGNQQLEYPWGATAPGTASQYAIYGCDFGSGGEAGTCVSNANIAPVGTASLGAGRWGQVDLVGNMYQWLLDGYQASFTACTDCAYIAGPYRLVRGGDFTQDPTALYPWDGLYDNQVFRTWDLGFRCARSP